MAKRLDKADKPATKQETEPVVENPFEFCANKKAQLEYKIMLARVEILNFLEGKTKSGKNEYQNFNYFETKDFLPQLMKILLSLKLYSKVEFKEGDISKLRVKDLETSEYTYVSEYPTPKRDGGNANKQSQNIGGLYTYAERYLYMKGFAIVENDTIDAESGKPTPSAKKTNFKQARKMSVQDVNKHMQGLPNPRDFDSAEKELNKLKIENRITQKTYEIVFNNIETAKAKQ